MTHATSPWRAAAVMTLAGGLAFWMANVAISLTPLAAAYRAAFSIPYWPMTAAALVGGLILAGGVSGLLLRFPERVPGGNPIVKAMILACLAMGVVEAFSLMVDAGRLSIFHLIGAGLNMPRFLALGATIGWVCRPLTGRPRGGLDQVAGSVR